MTRIAPIGLLIILACSSMASWAQPKVDTSVVKLAPMSDSAKRRLLHRTEAEELSAINNSVVITPAYKSTKGVFCKPLPVGLRSLEEFYRIRVHLTQRCEHVNYQSP